MIIDTSAIICVVKGEPLARRVLDWLVAGGPKRISAATMSELFAVVTRTVAPEGWEAVDRLVDALEIEIVPYDSQQLRYFRQGYQLYGRGGHNESSARLNLGDCFSYALARACDEPLLFIGDDFTHTDVVPVLDSTMPEA